MSAAVGEGEGRVGLKSKEGDVETVVRLGCVPEDVTCVIGMPAYSEVGALRTEGLVRKTG